jgi:hypothetical protein
MLCSSCHERRGVPALNDKCVTCSLREKPSAYRNDNSLSTLLKRACKKDCPDCSGTGLVWFSGSVGRNEKTGQLVELRIDGGWIFCLRCLGDRVSGVWSYLNARFAPKEARPVRRRAAQ